MFYNYVKDWKRIVIILWKTDSRLFCLLLIMSLLQSIMPISLLWVSKNIIDTLYVIVTTSMKDNSIISSLIIFVVVYGILNVLSNSFGYIDQLISSIMGEKVTNHINSLIIEKASELDLEHFENPQFYNMLVRASKEASIQPVNIMRSILNLFKDMLSIISYLIVLINFHWVSIAVIVLSMVPTIVNQKKYSLKSYRMYIYQTDNSRKMDYIFKLFTSKDAIKEIKLFNLWGYLKGKYHEYFLHIFQERKEHFTKRNIAGMGTSLISYTSYYSIYCLAIYRLVYRYISFGDFVFYTGAFTTFQSCFSSIVSNAANIYEKKLFLNNLFEFLDISPQIRTSENYIKMANKIKTGICLEDVSFKYSGTDRYVLRNVSFEISSGECVAIVGHNGAGKSTLVKLLLRLYEPTSGTITIDGVNINNLSLEEYHSRINVLFQDYYKYSFTARENVSIGAINKDECLRKVIAATKSAGIHEAITQLPKGYDTVLGKELGEFSDLSIGEWQKIALARALIKDAEIIILDEPSSSLDPIAENELFTKFYEINKNKISLFISHRLATVTRANKIILLNKGKIAALGTHSRLMAESQLYTHYFNIQADKYK